MKTLALDRNPSRRVLARVSLLFAFAAAFILVDLAVIDFPRGTVALGVLVAAQVAMWESLVRRGAVRIAGLVAGALLVAVSIVLVWLHRPALGSTAIVSLAVAIATGTAALRIRRHLRRAPRPRHPVVIWNPRSGDGKAARVHLADEARARGIEPIELRKGMDLEELARAILDEGADAIAMAGGDGSQAIVARIAAERGVPFACIPSGTRNHFALDLGVDRNDVIGALDAFVEGGERCVDLGEVNGRVFVNNVSLGLYGEAVQRASYRSRKVRTVLETVPAVLAPRAPRTIRWRGPSGEGHQGAAMFVVSNNPYRLGRGVGDGTRPRLDEGVLGVIALARPGEEPGIRTWSARTLEIEADGPVHVGIDGEAAVLEPPLRFGVRPAALRCRVALAHPGAPPSAWAPDSVGDAVRRLVRIAFSERPRESMPVPV